MLSLSIAVEDELSEAVVRKLATAVKRGIIIDACHRRGGFGYLKANVEKFNAAANNIPFLVLTDLDNAECPVSLIRDWFRVPKHPNLLFRIAVREVEAWLLADRDGFAKFLKVSAKLVPADPERCEDPKRTLVDLARRSKIREVREDIVPEQGFTVKQGPAYNSRLIEFVNESWNCDVAAKYAPSLARMIDRLSKYHPLPSS